MVRTGAKITLQEFLALPEGDVTYEFVDSQAVAKVSPKFFHSSVQRALLSIVGIWCKGRGRFLPEWAIVLKCNGQDWIPVPDVTYISYQRLPASWKRNEACPSLPELVIEIISPDQTLKKLADKAKDYLKAGVSRVWVIDPEALNIWVFSSDKAIQYTDIMPIVDVLLPDLEITPRQIFQEAELL